MLSRKSTLKVYGYPAIFLSALRLMHHGGFGHMAKRFVLIVPLDVWLDCWRRIEYDSGPASYELESRVIGFERCRYPCVLAGQIESHFLHGEFPLVLCRLVERHVVLLCGSETSSLESLCRRWRLSRWALGKCDCFPVPVRVQGYFTNIPVHVQAEKLREWLKTCG